MAKAEFTKLSKQDTNYLNSQCLHLNVLINIKRNSRIHNKYMIVHARYPHHSIENFGLSYMVDNSRDGPVGS